MNTVSSKRVSRRTFVKIGAAATSILAIPSIVRAQQRMLTYATWGGASQESQRAAFFDDFEKDTGIRVIDVPGTDQAKLAAMVQNRAVEWDLMDSIPGWLAYGARHDLYEPIDYTGINTDGVATENANPYGLGFSTNAKVLAFNTSALKGGKPTSFRDFWDVEKFRTRRAMYDGPRYNLETAVFAAGKATDQIYPIDLDEAFASLDRIKGSINIWFKQWQQIPTMIASNEIGMTLTGNTELGAVMRANPDAPIDFVWEGGVVTTDYATIPKGAKNIAEAHELLAWISDPARQAKYCNLTAKGPVNTGALPMIDQSLARFIPTEHVESGALINVSADWYADNLEIANERWLNWKFA